MPGNDDKTEKASSHKRMQERKKGNVFQSRDLISAIMIIVTFLALRALSSYMFGRFIKVLNDFITMSENIKNFNVDEAVKLMFNLVLNVLMLALPILAVAMLLGVVTSVAQTRFVFTTEVLKPKFERINFINGIKKMFSLKSLVELLKSIIKIVIIIAVIYTVIIEKLYDLPGLVALDIRKSAQWLGESIFMVAMYGGAGMAAIGVLDYFYQWWEHERSLKMSKQEMKEEYKQLEGDPQVKGRIKSIQRQMSQDRMMAGVKDADVVIRNPQHYAVALRYNIKEDDAPMVIAKGMDHLALRIVKEAELHNIEIIENPPLARGLYAAVDIGYEIPDEFYEALTDIMVYILYEVKKMTFEDLNAKK